MSEAPPARVSARAKVFIGLVLGALLAGGSYGFWQASEQFGERHEVLDQVRRLEAAVRKHDYSVIGLVEESHGTSPVKDPLGPTDRDHAEMFQVLEALGHLEGFALEPCHVHLDEAAALARCGVKGNIKPEMGSPFVKPAPPTPPPRALEITFRRAAPDNWQIYALHVIPE